MMVRAIFMAGFRVGVPGTDVWRMYRRVRVSTKIKPPDSRLVNITAVFVEGGVLNEQDPSETFSQPNDHALCGRLVKGMYTNLDEDRKGGSAFGLQYSLYCSTSGHSPNVHVQSSGTQAPPNHDEPTS